MKMRALTALTHALRDGGKASIDRGVSSGDGFWGKRSEGVESPRCAQGGAAIGAGEEGVDGGSQRARRDVLDQDSRPVVRDDVGQATRIERDHRRFAQLRFDGNKPESLVHGWNDERGSRPIVLSQLLLRKRSDP